MANSARNTPGVEPETVYPEIDPMEKVQGFYETNKKMLSTATTVILVVVVGYFGYTKMYKGPAEEKAAAAMYYPQLYFQADSLNLALNGDGKNLGFSKLAKKFSGTSAGNLASYYEGVCYLKMGDFKNAIKSLQEFDGKGTMVGRQAFGELGMAYMETGNSAKAIENFKKATEDKEDGLVTPMYLYQLGVAYQAAGNNNEAKDAFKRIRDEYPRSPQARDMDKELARLGELN
jgi:tetratricopeptide (TPR) repeat protein